MASRTSHGLLWTYPSRAKLFLLVVIVVGTLTVLSLYLILKSHNLEQAPQSPAVHPIARLTLLQKHTTQLS
jgi:hypothetical protein